MIYIFFFIIRFPKKGSMRRIEVRSYIFENTNYIAATISVSYLICLVVIS